MSFDLLCCVGKKKWKFFFPKLIISYLNQKLTDWRFTMFILQLERNDFVIKYMFNSSSGIRLKISKRDLEYMSFFPDKVSIVNMCVKLNETA